MSSDLFDSAAEKYRSERAPLADRMRPRTLDEYVGQEHILGPSRLLRRAIEADRLSSILLFGPPGTGKTTLARIIANTTKAHFVTLNAVLSGVKDIRAAIFEATERLRITVRGPSCLSTKSIGSTSLSRMPCCLTLKTGQ